MDASYRHARVRPSVVLFVALVLIGGRAEAQSKIGPDSISRWKFYGVNLVRTGVGALVFAGIDQIRDEPEEWGHGWSGFGKRLGSEVAGGVIQETVNEAIAAAMNRPLTYTRCACHGFWPRTGWALKAGVTDQMPDGSAPIAVPRIVAAYVGGFARSTWNPNADNDRLGTTLVSGTSSLAIGALINMAYEFVIR